MVCRFTAQELHTLITVLELPDPLLTLGGYCAISLESLALLCAHLWSPDTQWALVNKYACLQSAISEIISETAMFINKHWGSFLDWDAVGLVHPQRLQEYADALQEFGAPCNTVIGFINCTIQPMCCLGVYQDLVYTRYKKCHSMKYQAIVVPNGLIAHLSCPFCAPQNDHGVLNKSNLLSHLESHAIQPGSQQNDPPECCYF